MVNRVLHLSDVRIFKIYPSKFVRKLIIISEALSNFDFENPVWPKFRYKAQYSKN